MIPNSISNVFELIHRDTVDRVRAELLYTFGCQPVRCFALLDREQTIFTSRTQFGVLARCCHVAQSDQPAATCSNGGQFQFLVCADCCVYREISQ